MKKIALIFMSIISLQTFVLGQNKKEILPNIIYILADDLGYGDVSVNNPIGKIKTPNIDQIALQGMRFTDAHSASGVCTPTRYAILTGRYPFRSKLPVGVLRGYSRSLIEKDQQTVAKLLSQAGYRTGVIGKWHLGVDWALLPGNEALLNQKDLGIKAELNPEIIDFNQAVTAGPQSAGFDYSYILPASLDMPPYLYLENQKVEEQPMAYTKGNKMEKGYSGPFWREGKMSPSFDFHQVLPRFIEKANQFISNQTKGQPFFLYLPLAAPHTPWMPNPEYIGKSGAGEYGDFVQQVDASVGIILKQLEKFGLAKNTIVIFASDNGPYWRPDFIEKFNHKSAGEFRGMKGDAYEGGHRIPFFVRWPAHVKANTISNTTTSLANLLATCSDLTGIKATSEDTYSILPILKGQTKTIKSQAGIVISSSIGYLSIRKGDWKLIEGLGSGGFTEPQKIDQSKQDVNGQLFNLKIDPKEEHDLFESNKEKVFELRTLLQEIKDYKKR
jgi:arylsulfatase A-like enzyme